MSGGSDRSGAGGARRGRTLLLALAALATPLVVGAATCGGGPTAPDASQQCRQVDLLSVCPADTTRVDTTASQGS